MKKCIRCNRFPSGKQKALTMSYDDGRTQDRRLVEIFNRYGIKGSFHLNSGKLGCDGYISADEVSSLFAGHEISVHSVTHPFLTNIPKESLIFEILEDRKALESLAGYPVRGMSYPFGAFNDEVVNAIRHLGIEYARTVIAHGDFSLPSDFMRWPATCHHNDKLIERGKQFLADDRWGEPRLMYVWGHSYEFDNNENWNNIEEFCDLIAGNDNIWYATNIEIVDYLNAVRNLKVSAEGTSAYNPSAVPVWITADGDTVRIEGGQTVKL